MRSVKRCAFWGSLVGAMPGWKAEQFPSFLTRDGGRTAAGAVVCGTPFRRRSSGLHCGAASRISLMHMFRAIRRAYIWAMGAPRWIPYSM